MRTKDRPLTNVEERVLIELRDLDADARTRWNRDGWQPREILQVRHSSTTLISLEEAGLVETNAALDREYPDWKRTRGSGARITEAGRAMCASMGD